MRPVLEILESRTLFSCVGYIPSLPCYDVISSLVAEFGEAPDGDNDTLDTQFQIGPADPHWFIRHVFLGAERPGQQNYGILGYSESRLSSRTTVWAQLDGRQGTDLDLDFWRVAQPSGTKFDFTVSGDHVDRVLVHLVDASGEPFARFEPDRTGVLRVVHRAPAESENYFVQVVQTEPAESLPSPYKLQLDATLADPFAEQEPNNEIESATPLQQLSVAVADWSFRCAQEPESDFCRRWFAWQAAFVPILFFAHGELGTDPGIDDSDYFSFTVPAGHRIAVALSGEAAEGGVVPELLRADGSVLARGEPSARHLWSSERWATVEHSTDLGGQFLVRVRRDVTGRVAESMAYELEVARVPDPNAADEETEHEPNNTFDTANRVELRPDPALRGQIRGELEIAGYGSGPSSCSDPDEHGQVNCTTDKIPYTYLGADFFSLEVPPGRDLHIDLTGGLAKSGGFVALFDAHRRGLVMDVDASDGVSLDWPVADGGRFFVEVFSLPQGPRCSFIGVYNSAGGQDLRLVCRPNQALLPGETATSYGLRVEAGDHTGSGIIKPIIEPETIVLGDGARFSYADSSGDRVRIAFRGRDGSATITFTGPRANGSDIASIEVAGVRWGGSLSIQSSGDAEVGAIVIRAVATDTVARPGRSRAAFGSIRIDGNVGVISSDLNVRSLAVDGVLGEVYAPGRRIGQLLADSFDAALSNVGSFLSPCVESDMVDRLFGRGLSQAFRLQFSSRPSRCS